MSKRMTGDEFTVALFDLGLSYKQFSRKSGVKLRTIYNYAGGKTRIPHWMPILIDSVGRIQEEQDNEQLPV